MQGVNTTLMSGVASQVKPFAGIISTSGEVLQQHTEIVKTDTETLVEQDKILKKTTFNMSQFKDELKSGGSKFNDGIKELTGGLVDISGLTETVGKKFKAIGDIGKGIASPVTSLFKSFSREEVDLEEQDQKAKLRQSKRKIIWSEKHNKYMTEYEIRKQNLIDIRSGT